MRTYFHVVPGLHFAADSFYPQPDFRFPDLA
jgi:hypothetical protein